MAIAPTTKLKIAAVVDSVTWANPALTVSEGATIALGAITGSWTVLTLHEIPPGATVSDGKGNSFTATAALNAVNITGWSVSTLKITTVSATNFKLRVETGDGKTASEAVTVLPSAPIVTWAPVPVPLAGMPLAGMPVALGSLSVMVGKLPGDGAHNTLASLIVSGVPAGATLSDGHGHVFKATPTASSVDVRSWTLTSLVVVAPGSVDFALTVTATEKDEDGNTSTATATEQVSYKPAAAVDHPPTLTATVPSAALVEASATVTGVATSVVHLAKNDPDGPATYVTAGWTALGGGLFLKAGTYGTATLDIAKDTLTYALDNTLAATDALAGGQAATDSFTVTVTGTGGPAIASATVSFAIAGTNDAAILSSATVALTEANTAAAISTGGALTITDVDSPALFVAQTATAGLYGAFSITAAGVWTYTATSAHDEFAAGSTYTDSFAVSSADGTKTSVVVTIAGTNDAAILSSATVALTEANTAAAISTGGALTITDVDSPALFVAQTATAGLYGAFSITAAGVWTYTATSAHDEFAAGSTYTDSFAVSSADGTKTSVVVTIAGTNDAPIFAQATVETTLLTGQMTAVDPEGAPVRYSVLPGLTGLPIGIGAYGALSLASNGSWTYTPDIAVLAGLPTGSLVQDSFTIGADDGAGGVATQTLLIDLHASNAAPAFTSAADAATVADTAAADVFAPITGALTATDANGDPLTFALDPGSAAAGLFGTLTVLSDGSWSYAPNGAAIDPLAAGAVQADVFTVRVSDGQGGVTTQALTFTLTGANDAPVLTSPADSTLLTGSLVATDAEQNALLYGLDATQSPFGAWGSIAIDAATGAWVYTPDPAAISTVPGGTPLADSFLVRTDDGFGGSASQVLTVHLSAVTPVPAFVTAPVALAYADTTAIDVFAPDGGYVGAADAASDPITYSIAGTGAYGTMTMDQFGYWTFAPDDVAINALQAGQIATDSFVVTADNGLGGTATQTMTVTVTGANDAPVFGTNSVIDLYPGTTMVTTLATDPDGPAPLTYSLTGPDAALFTVVANSLAFKAAPDPAAGLLSYSVAVTASDGAASTTQAYVVNTVSPPPASPFTVIDPTQAAANAAAIAGAILGNTPGITADLATLGVVAGSSSAMFYDGSLTQLGIGKGLLITSGTMPGTSNTTGSFGVDIGMPGNPALDAIVRTVYPATPGLPGAVSYDATMINFNFTVTDPTITGISLNAVFGSEEFPEWVDQFVDIGAVIVNGTDVAYFNNNPLTPLSVIGANLANGAFIDNTINIDPTTGLPIPGVASRLPIEYDGVSRPLTIYAPVHQGVNTIEIAIADTGDHIYDSGLFISNLAATSAPVSGVLIDVPCTSGNDTVAGTGAAESIDGGAGNDIIDGGGGNDVILGGSGNDTLAGGTGDDFIDGGTGTNTVNGGDGNDTIQHGSAVGVDTIDGGTGINTLALNDASATAGETVDLSNPSVLHTLLDGSTFINMQALTFHGGSGADVIVGGAGIDVIDGGAGNDTLTGGGGNDTITGGAGTDTAVYSGASSDYAVTTLGTDLYQVADLRAGTPDGVDQVSGIEFLKFANGTFAINNLPAPAVTITGTANDDVINPAQTVAGQPAVTNNGDTIYGLGGDDRIQGGAGADTIYGGAGNDFINGGAGDDTIVGGLGNDELTGGLGADRFVFLTAGDSLPTSRDVILDFSQAQGDKIDLTAMGNFSIVAAFTGTAAQLVIRQSGDGYLVQGDTTGAGAATFAIQVDTTVVLTTADFVH